LQGPGAEQRRFEREGKRQEKKEAISQRAQGDTMTRAEKNVDEALPGKSLLVAPLRPRARSTPHLCPIAP
jgi:hypothetical protein